jgi:hypothetical protein
LPILSWLSRRESRAGPDSETGLATFIP